MKIVDRRCTGVVQVHFELEYQVYDKMVDYCNGTGMSKRKLMETAISVWLKQREIDEREAKRDGLV
jgi:hypothetical protein